MKRNRRLATVESEMNDSVSSCQRTDAPRFGVREMSVTSFVSERVFGLTAHKSRVGRGWMLMR